MITACPECEARVPFADHLRVSELVECPECRNELEVVGLDPPMLGLAPEPEEDWGE